MSRRRTAARAQTGPPGPRQKKKSEKKTPPSGAARTPNRTRANDARPRFRFRTRAVKKKEKKESPAPTFFAAAAAQVKTHSDGPARRSARARRAGQPSPAASRERARHQKLSQKSVSTDEAERGVPRQAQCATKQPGLSAAPCAPPRPRREPGRKGAFHPRSRSASRSMRQTSPPRHPSGRTDRRRGWLVWCLHDDRSIDRSIDRWHKRTIDRGFVEHQRGAPGETGLDQRLLQMRWVGRTGGRERLRTSGFLSCDPNLL